MRRRCGEAPFIQVTFENYREPALMQPHQAEHLAGLFNGIGFCRREMPFWEACEFSNEPSCQDIILRHESPDITTVMVHGVTATTLRNHAPALEAGLRTLPAMLRAKI